MHLLSQVLWLFLFAVAAAILALLAHEVMAVPLASAVLGAAVLFVLTVQFHAALRRRRERADVEHRLMALYEDYQTALAVADEARIELGALKHELGGAERRSNSELIAELKVLQTLLAQVVAKSARSGPDVEASVAARATRASGAHAPASGNGNGARGSERDEILAIMHNALEENRVDLYLQPIVRLPSRKPLYYEAYSRVRDEAGRIIFPRQFLPLAEESGLIGTLDNLLLFRCIQVIRRLGPRRPNLRFFCNISSASLEDKDFFPQFIDFMMNNLELADRLVFEFAQADVRQHGPEIERSLATLGRRGFHFSMDHVTDLDFDPVFLAARHFSFVKVAAEVLRHGESAIEKEDLRESLARHQIDLIVEKVEDEPTIIELLDYGIEYGQGYLFGEPRPSRDEAAFGGAAGSGLGAASGLGSGS